MKKRDFLKKTTGAAIVAAPTIIPSSVLGQGDKPAPSNRITLGLIGCGGQGTGDMRGIMSSDDIQTLAVCDPEQAHAERAKKHVDDKYKNTDCATYADYRQLCERKDIDAVIVGTPDHWHALACLAALRNGKDVYCEKPITHLFGEGQAVYKEAAKQNAIFQVGSQQRSNTRFRVAAEAVMNGLIGKIKEVKVGLPTGKGTDKSGKVGEPIPAGLDYDLWCGPSRYLPFQRDRLHWNWRWCLDYGGGQLMDWIGHHNDIAHWGLEKDKSGPIKVEAKNFSFPEKGMWDNPINYEVVSTYEEGYTVTLSNKHVLAESVDEKTGKKRTRTMGTKWIGENGWVYVDRGHIEASNMDWARESNERGPKKAYKSNNHHQNFVEGVKTRKECICPAETGHRSATPGHLGYISLALGRPLKWDPIKEEVLGDPAADKLLKQVNYRGDWSLDA